MGVGISEQSSGALPFQTFLNQNQTTNSVQNDSSQGFEQNRYTDAQKGAQNFGLGGLSAMLSGQTSAPDSMGLSQAVWDKARLEFNKGPAFQLAAQNGAGSPSIASAQAQQQLGLAAESGKMAMQNTLQGYDSLMNYAYTPVGKDQGQQATSNKMSSTQTNATETGVDYGGLLGGLSYALSNLSGGTFPASPYGVGSGGGSGWI